MQIIKIDLFNVGKKQNKHGYYLEIKFNKKFNKPVKLSFEDLDN